MVTFDNVKNHNGSRGELGNGARLDIGALVPSHWLEAYQGV